MTVLAWAGLFSPLYNWDLVGYTACALEAGGCDPALLQGRTYGLLEESVPEDAYSELASSTPGRVARATDPSSLGQHLPFYRVRPAYVLLLAGLMRCGLDPGAASSIISTAAAVVSLLLLLRLVPGYSCARHRILVSIGCLGGGLATVARHATPDALACLAFVSCSALLLRRRGILLLLLPVCALVRADLLLAVLPFHAYIFHGRIFGRLRTAASAAASILAAASAGLLLGGYGWATVFNYTFVDHSDHPASISASVAIRDYLGVMRNTLSEIPLSETWVFGFLAVLLAGILLMKARSAAGSGSAPARAALVRDIGFILLLSGGYFIMHFLIFPAAWIRFFAGQVTTAVSLSAFLCLDRTGREGRGDSCILSK
jgi:hypothetical protein